MDGNGQLVSIGPTKTLSPIHIQGELHWHHKMSVLIDLVSKPSYLEYLDIIKPDIPTGSVVDLATQGSTQLGLSQNTQNGDGSGASQQEMYKVMLHMNVSLHRIH
jgi:hypothetical protein